MKINFKNTWRPLPSSVTIKNSTIEGLGLFAVEDISQDTDLGLLRFTYHGTLIRTALGSFPNHCEKPNCINISSTNKYGDEEYTLTTLQDIKAGDELTLCYQMKQYYE
jgi:hypothetical protein|tara:strand:+ start:2614 stop:2937 length:324 start_codon:yes stop_codon:yes gene_type:complete